MIRIFVSYFCGVKRLNEPAKVCDEVLAIHDSTHVIPTAKAPSIEEFKQSPDFFTHLTLLTSRSESRKVVYGIGAMTFWARGSHCQIEGKNQTARWLTQVNTIEERIGDQSQITDWSRPVESVGNKRVPFLIWTTK